MNPHELIARLERSRRRLEERGFNLWGVTRLEDFDGSQCREGRLLDGGPSEVSVIVLGSGGRSLWGRLREGGRLDEGRRSRHPIDDYSREVLGEEARSIREAGIPVCTIFPFDRKPIDFLSLAASAGLGRISPVAPFFLHPEYGPWVSLRGAFVLPIPLPQSGELEDFEPCATCLCPCREACPAGAGGDRGGYDIERCAVFRHEGGCESGCGVRRACTIGRDHAWSEEEEAFRHSFSLATMRRWFGLGAWRFVPESLRRRL